MDYLKQGPKIRVMVYAGDAIKGENADEIAKEIASILGGAGGGSAKFAQGGGKDTSKKEDAIKNAKSMILGKEEWLNWTEIETNGETSGKKTKTLKQIQMINQKNSSQ